MLLPKPIILIYCRKKKKTPKELDIQQGIELMEKEPSEKGLLEDYDQISD